MVGAFFVGKGPTNIDPTGILLYATTTKIFNVDEQDLTRLSTDYNYSAAKSLAYYESVTQVPLAIKGKFIYDNVPHKPANKPILQSKSTRYEEKEDQTASNTDQKLVWFANSWDGNSWKRNIKLDNGGPPCFWTKDLSDGDDPFTLSWRLYDAKYPDRGWRVTYEKFPTYESVLEQLKSFLALHSSEPEVHIWIQGNQKGLSPQLMVNALRDDVVNITNTSLPTVDVLIMPSGTGKSTYASMYPELLDVDDIINAPSVKGVMKTLRKRAMQDMNFDELNNLNGELVLDALTKGDIAGRILLIHGHDTLGNALKINVLGSGKLPKKEMLDIAKMRGETDDQWSKLTELNWTTSKTPIMSRSAMNGLVREVVRSHQRKKLDLTVSPVTDKTYEYRKYWKSDLVDSRDMWDVYGSRRPTRIPVIPWRVCNVGMRVYGMSLPPQLFPSSNVMRKYGIEDFIDYTEVYHNYSEHVTMIEISEADRAEDGLDFGWRYLGQGMYSMMDISSTDYKLYKVEDSDFFKGLGTVVTSAHACFGFGRTNDDLISQLERKEKTGYGTSGHMIASVLAFRSHFLWYLTEVDINIMTNETIYITPFKEPESGLYHISRDYVNALDDIKLASQRVDIPEHAKANFEICKQFVGKMRNVD
jgi:hypothetical protein